ncbi:MAG: YpdA family putative bacillithiol disulfide reductase [Anaerolineae bacterium]|nr:YpdA family putative bacillithiol disulfide reductase [Gemmatimonadaceae bacterium]
MPAHDQDVASADVVVVGAGPCGLAAAIATQSAGHRTIVLERTSVVSGLASYPTYMTFFSTAAKLAIGGIPFVVATEKPARRDALAYYRAVVEHFDLDVRQYEEVLKIGVGSGGLGMGSGWSTVEESNGEAGRGMRTAPRLVVHSVSRVGERRETGANALVVATGYFGRPNLLGVPGESLPHVSHLYREGHQAFRQDVVVVGGGNSAVDAALDLYRCGARVTLVHFGPTFDKNIKPWVLPDMNGRLADGSIAVQWNSRVSAITPKDVVIDSVEGEKCIPATHVYLMLGYLPEVGLLRDLGVPIDSRTGIPEHDAATMETPIPGVFIAGVIASGFDANKTFIENGRFHGELIAKKLGSRESGIGLHDFLSTLSISR